MTTCAGRRFFRSTAAPVALAAAMISPVASAQADGAQASGETQAASDVIVTGSRVARPGFQSPNPMTVLTAEDLENSSPTSNIADVVNQLPELAGSVTPGNSRLSISAGTAGINTLNLRNIGTSRTLVLLDGRRLVGSTADGRVDINTLPQSLVKRVDVVTGGASAAYGSNAVAGVVNFILDTKYTGIKGSVDAGITEEGDRFNYSANLTAGFSFADGRGQILLDGEWLHQDGVFKARSWNRRGYLRITNPDYSAATPNGQPQHVVRWGVGSNTLIPGGIINAGPLKGTYFGAGGSVHQFDYGTYSNSLWTIGGDWQLTDAPHNVGMAETDDRRGAFGRVSFEVAPWLELYAEASYHWQTTLFEAAPQQGTTTLRGDNAYLINALGAAKLAGIASVTMSRTAPDWPSVENNNTRSVQRYTVGGEGQFTAFGNGATWSAYASYGEANAHEQINNIRHNTRYTAAYDAVFAPAGNALGVPAGTIVCRSSLTAPTNGCLPLNLVGTGVADPAALAYALGDPWRDQKLQQFVTGVDLSFTPFQTWAGDVSVAMGAAYRHEKVSGYVPPEFQTGWSYGNFLPTFGSSGVKEAYLEAVVPLGLGLEVNGAVRGVDYSRSGYVTTWKAGATWQPVPDILFRATQSRDIREPNLSELYATGTSRSNTLRDPFTGMTGVPFFESTVGNPDLNPERGNSTTAGIVLRPQAVPNLSISADWFRTKVEEAISSFSAQDIIDFCYRGNQQFCAFYGPDPSGARTYAFRATRFNASSLRVSGVDFAINYRLPIGNAGRLLLNGNVTRYIYRYVETGIPEDVSYNTVGELGGTGPGKWVFRATATYDTPTWAVTATGRGLGAGNYNNTYIQCASNCPVSTIENPTIDNNRIPGVFYADLNIKAKIGDTRLGNAEMFFNVTNLFDRLPILLPETTIGANMTYSNLLGRAFRIGVRFKTK